MHTRVSDDNRSGVITLLLLVAGGVCLLCVRATLGEEDASSGIEQTRTAMEKWVETRRIISQEKRDLTLAREMLNERIDLVEQEIASLWKKINEAKESIAEADKKRADMLEENDKLKHGSALLEETVASLEGRTRGLSSRLPEPIRERIKPLSQRLPVGGGASELSVAERFQNVVGILNEVNKFNRDITVTSEVRSLSDGSSVEVAALYVGVGQGYYATVAGDVGGTGTAAADTWEWQGNNEAAGQIAQAISILKNEAVASFTQLPVDIQ